MQSNIDPTKPTNTEPRIEDLRTNFAAAKTEIESAHARIDTLDSTTQTLTTASNTHGDQIASLDGRVSTIEQGGGNNGGGEVNPLDLWQPKAERWTLNQQCDIDADTWTPIPYDSATYDTTAQPQAPDYLLPWQDPGYPFRALTDILVQYTLAPPSNACTSQVRIGDDAQGWTTLEPATHPAGQTVTISRTLSVKRINEQGYCVEIKTSTAATIPAAGSAQAERQNAVTIRWTRAAPAPQF